MKEHISLTALLQNVKAAIAQAIPTAVWVRAEISELQVNYAGHCFMELIDKSGGADAVSAKARATIWASLFRMIHAYFEASTGQRLEKGLKILVKVSVELHEVYGLSLNVTDIDPAFTVGEQEMERRRIIKRIEDEGVADMNKALELPLVIQRIAVISSETAAGYGDFSHQIIHNNSYIHFSHELFPCVMQGQKTAESVISALDAIYGRESEFDVVVIIRGGGSKSDLAWFDNYDLAINIAQFPLPVLSGIGHERDTSIVDMVAHSCLKTPTAVAEFIIGKAEMFESRLDELHATFRGTANDIIASEREYFRHLRGTLEPSISQLLARSHTDLQNNAARLTNISNSQLRKRAERLSGYTMAVKDAVSRVVSTEKMTLESRTGRALSSSSRLILNNIHKVDVMKEKVNAHDHLKILGRGYTLTLDAGRKIIRSCAQVTSGETITTVFTDGQVESTIL